MNREQREQRELYLDGFRDGLGDAIARIDTVAKEIPQILCRACPGPHTELESIIGDVLAALMKGLRLVSASAVLKEDNDE